MKDSIESGVANMPEVGMGLVIIYSLVRTIASIATDFALTISRMVFPIEHSVPLTLQTSSKSAKVTVLFQKNILATLVAVW
jgi:hypothetical protein